jgi:alkylation response protein AidB-like acyl-CoA dehydrogenase
MLKRSQVTSLCNKFPGFADQTLSLRAAPKIPKGLIKETEEVVAYCRKFNDEVARPLSLELDRKTHEDPNYFPWELVKKANEWGFYTMWVPKAFGGKGYNMASMSYAVEELASCDLGITNVICVHYLGVASLMMTGEAKITRKILNEVARGEKSGDPCIIALAITEPNAGTDVEEVDLEDKGKIICHARKVKGGYIVDGSKIFISMGHLSRWTVLIAYTDLKKASETTVVMMVKEGMKGFTFGTHENKMGQRICPASVLNFEECFVPDELVLLDPERIEAFTKKPVRDVKMQYVDYVVTTTRPGVGALGTGAARGAYEAALKYVNETEIDGRPMSHYEWVQCRLAEMYANVRLARLGYEDANYASQLHGMLGLVQNKPAFYFQKYMPQGYFDNVMAPMLDKPGATKLMSNLYYDKQKPKDQHICTGLASLAKFSGTDLGIRNCQMAIELMGTAGLRHENRVEKMLRDAKLLQIYEGTNQLNRLNLFKSLIAPACPQAKNFEA